MNSACKRVLSIQSHVVHGYVGNKSATFPLQVLGYEVDGINSVQFSNHTGYKCFKGQILNAENLRDLFSGLEANNLTHKYTHLLTGYVGSKSFLLEINDVIERLKQTNPNLIYVCDPVMGDAGKMYVPPELLPVYKNQILRHADIITPNQFEAELLTGLKISDMDSAQQALIALQDLGAKTVVLSSTDLGDDQLLIGLARGPKGPTVKFEMSKFPVSFTGTGDLFSALLLAWSDQLDITEACSCVASTMQSVLRRTIALHHENGTEGPMELKLIQSKELIEHPEMSVTIKVIE